MCYAMTLMMLRPAMKPMETCRAAFVVFYTTSLPWFHGWPEI